MIHEFMSDGICNAPTSHTHSAILLSDNGFGFDLTLDLLRLTLELPLRRSKEVLVFVSRWV